MGCFPCFGSEEEEANNSNGVKNVSKKESFREDLPAQSNRVNSDKSKSPNRNDSEKDSTIPKDPITHIAAQTFTFRELSAATKKFRHASLLGEDGFGRVYKGRLESTGKVVAVKKLDQEEFWVELEMLSNLHHENIVKLIGYCSEGDDRRFIVCEYFPLGSLQYNLHDHPPYKEPLDWNTRIKIAAGVAKGLEYLHEKTDPPVIYRDLKSSSIFLDDEFFPKLFDFNSATLHHVPSKTTMISGYCAPEFAITGQLTLKSDMYSFGVLLLELITGRKAFDNTKDTEERNLVEWAKLRLQHRRLYSKMVDPLLQGRYPAHELYEALTLAAKCVQEQPSTRCSIAEVVTALTYLASQNYDPATSSFNGTNQ